ncbi:MAG TPA: mechanosensitive ion channel family protein [Segeticoccus sp.]|uniref:mechanosensitive ion channel family protein n=1 Tax=Segeticoccus sp. TaxID=2706531 RepID=UPI002D80D955|nr:mechanosensitive ion channel family protein [Segeticoccus sp.]HET8602093.1 mechanosensitive ion channel family protein [Segeticoccus sp.]
MHHPDLHVPTAVDWESVGQFFLGAPLVIVCIIIGALVLRWLIHRAIDRLVQTTTARTRTEERETGDTGGVRARATAAVARATRHARERQRQRMATMGSVLKSVTTLVLGLLALLTIMAEVGIPLAPLLASAGVGGVALGFGAQSLVKDFLSGIFMIVEDQYGVGDVVDTGDVLGTVEEVSLRVTRVRDFTGVIWYIRNGEILRIANHSQGWSTAIVDVPVAATADVDKVLELIATSVEELNDSGELKDQLLEAPVVAGVQSVSPGVVTIRVTAKCAPVENYGAQRAILAHIKTDLDRAGVRQPVPMVPFGGAPATT